MKTISGFCLLVFIALSVAAFSGAMLWAIYFFATIFIPRA